MARIGPRFAPVRTPHAGRRVRPGPTHRAATSQRINSRRARRRNSAARDAEPSTPAPGPTRTPPRPPRRTPAPPQGPEAQPRVQHLTPSGRPPQPGPSTTPIITINTLMTRCRRDEPLPGVTHPEIVPVPAGSSDPFSTRRRRHGLACLGHGSDPLVASFGPARPQAAASRKDADELLAANRLATDGLTLGARQRQLTQPTNETWRPAPEPVPHCQIPPLGITA